MNEETKFKINDTVKVINNGQTYASYDVWKEKHNLKDWRSGLNCKNGQEGTIIEVGEHSSDSRSILCGVRIENRTFIIHEEGLELVTLTIKQTLGKIKMRVKDVGESRRVQEALFKLGYGWSGSGTKIQYVKSPFLYAEEGGDKQYILHGTIESMFESESNKEVTPEYIINLADIINLSEQQEPRVRGGNRMGYKEGDIVRIIKRLSENTTGSPKWYKNNDLIGKQGKITNGTGQDKFVVYSLDDKEYYGIFKAGEELEQTINKETEYQAVFKEENKMELKDIKTDNLKLARQQFEKDNNTEEVRQALLKLEAAHNRIDCLDRDKKVFLEEDVEARKPHLEVIAAFKKIKLVKYVKSGKYKKR